MATDESHSESDDEAGVIGKAIAICCVEKGITICTPCWLRNPNQASEEIAQLLSTPQLPIKMENRRDGGVVFYCEIEVEEDGRKNLPVAKRDGDGRMLQIIKETNGQRAQYHDVLLELATSFTHPSPALSFRCQ